LIKLFDRFYRLPITLGDLLQFFFHFLFRYF
jgi:hypothetical protein